MIHTDWLESCGARAVICVVAWAFVGLMALLTANAAEVDGASTLLQYDCYDLPLDVELGIEHVDPGTAARIIAFAEIGRDRCGFGPFPTWSVFKRYGLRERDFKVTMESVGERSGDGAIGPYFQLLLDAEDEAAQPSTPALEPVRSIWRGFASPVWGHLVLYNMPAHGMPRSGPSI